jgi:electron transport complex protein RnfG
MSENNNNENNSGNIENTDNENNETTETTETIETTDDVAATIAEDGVFDVPQTIEAEVIRNQRSPINFKDSIFGTAAILAIIAVVTVFAISLLNEVTSPIIEQRLREEKASAIEWLFGSHIEFSELTEFEDLYLNYGTPVLGVFLVVDDQKIGDDKTAGYCVMVAPKGFTDSIIMLVAVNPNVTVKDTLILSMSETVGYGTRIESDGDGWFRDQFKNKSRNITDVRTEPAPDENAVQIVIGATVTSRAFLKGVNAALDIVDEIIGSGFYFPGVPPAEPDETEEPERPEELPPPSADDTPLGEGENENGSDESDESEESEGSEEPEENENANENENQE